MSGAEFELPTGEVELESGLQEAPDAGFGMDAEPTVGDLVDAGPAGEIGVASEPEWSAGLGHWLFIFAFICGAWWWRSRTSSRGTGGGGGGLESHPQHAADLRRKRLEALQKSSQLSEASTKGDVSSSSTKAAVATVSTRGSDESKEGLRRRQLVPCPKQDTKLEAKSEVPASAKVAATIEAAPMDEATAIPTPAKPSKATAAESAAAPSITSPSGGGAVSSAVDATASVCSTEDVSDDGPDFAIRAQGSLGGVPGAYLIKDLRGSTTVADLGDRIAKAFGSGDDVRLRLFYMGRELKDPGARLGAVGMKPNATVQAMFSGGMHPSPGSCAEGTAPAASATPPAVCATETPAQAWQAMAVLEEQLARATDMREDETVRQASLVLKQMLTTMTHDNNPMLVQMAQAMVPDLSKIWAFEPTRQHLCGLLRAAPAQEAGESWTQGASQSSSSGP